VNFVSNATHAESLEASGGQVRVAWLMLDGVGLMPHGATHPFKDGEYPTLERLGISLPRLETNRNWLTRAIDARLGVDGLPQSGTGQTTILSGINAAQAMNRHYGPWVSPSLRRILEDNILKRVAANGGTVRLANFYPPRYLEALETGEMRLNAIATAALSAGAKLEGMDGLGIAPMLRDPGAEVNLERVSSWARAFVASTATVTIFDEWWTDNVGHEMNLSEAQDFAARLEVFCRVALEERSAETLFLVTSDHGNFEDLSVKTHTFNPVPLAAVGPSALEFASVTDLTGVTPVLTRVLRVRKPSS
jgi:2,3-bisphosphoglycerate-independent phosphoglycerate mutase